MTLHGNGGVCTSVGNILSATASASITGGVKGSVSSISASPSQTISVVVATSIIATSTPTPTSEAGTVGHQVINFLTIRKLPVIVFLSCLVCQLVLAGFNVKEKHVTLLGSLHRVSKWRANLKSLVDKLNI
jgi:hypothetical protein